MITVFVSTSPSPLASQTPFEVDLSDGDTLPVNVPLYAAAVDTEDAGATFSFSWHLLRKPQGSGAALDNALISTPTLEDVDLWGNYYLFAIATNTSSGDTSERDFLQAPNSAFTSVFVRSETLALIKPAAGERDWFTKSYEWVEAIEELGAESADYETRITALEGATPSLEVGDLADVNLSELSVGEALVWDGSEWVNQMAGGGGGAESLSIDAAGDSAVLTLASETLAFEADEGVVISGNSETAGQFTIVVGLSSTLAVDISGNALTSTTSGSADVAIQLDTPNVLSLSGDLSGSATIGGADFTPTLNATIGSGVVENSMLQNSGITFGTAANSEVIALGEGLVFAGTANEVEVAYSTATNTLTVGLPSSITANASTATALQTSRTISLSGGATGSASFNGTANAAISTTLATATTAVRGGVLLDQATAYGNSSAFILNRERLVFNADVDQTYSVLTTIQNKPSISDAVDEFQNSAANIGLRAIAIFRNPFKTTMHIDQWSAVIGYGGIEGGDGETQLELVKFSNIAAVRTNTYTATGNTLTLTGTDNSPKANEADYGDELTGPTVDSGGYFGVILVNSTKNPGHMLHIQIVGSRAVGVGDY